MRRYAGLLTFAVGRFHTGSIAAQDCGVPAEWEVLKLLVGSCEEAIDGSLGTGSGVREYEFVLRDRYLLSRHSSVRLPQGKKYEGRVFASVWA